ncbi:MAG: plasmid pRiA4b ORF-3 family protein, partial [Dermatophilaceae bacterium]
MAAQRRGDGPSSTGNPGVPDNEGDPADSAGSGDRIDPSLDPLTAPDDELEQVEYLPIMFGVDGPSPELVADIALSFTVPVAEARTALEAETSLSYIIGLVRAGTEGDAEDAERSVGLMLAQVVDALEKMASAEALAVLRVLAVYGQDRNRSMAMRAGRRLAESGVHDAPWAGRVGRPEFVRAWSSSDGLGAQTSLGLLFTDDGTEHAVMLLIDHDLGGGVKDAWTVEGSAAGAMRERVLELATGESEMEFADLDVAEAAAMLRDAMAAPPCPVEPDQVEDATGNFELVRVRCRWLCRLAGIDEPEYALDLSALALPESFTATDGSDAGTDDGAGLATPTAGSPEPRVAHDAVLRLKVSLDGIRPPVWRRLEVRAGMLLREMHHVVQVAFDWNDIHLHCFETVPPKGSAGSSETGRGELLEGDELDRVALADLLGAVGDRLLYRYDFGDNWEHLIEVEEIEDAAPDTDYPRCTGGRRAGPPEDSGGVPGYADLLEAIADPSGPGHRERLDSMPSGWDPARFDRDEIDERLAR